MLCLFQPKMSSEKWFPQFLVFDATRKCWSTEYLFFFSKGCNKEEAIFHWLPNRGGGGGGGGVCVWGWEGTKSLQLSLSPEDCLPPFPPITKPNSPQAHPPDLHNSLDGFGSSLQSTPPFTLHTLASSLTTPTRSSTSDPTMVTTSAPMSMI
jgi:hypothetical protein